MSKAAGGGGAGGAGGGGDECVKVVVRIRPMSAEEERNGNLIATEAFPDRGLITVKNPKASDR